MTVWCVLCIDGVGQVVHIFSTPEKANEFCQADMGRIHISYDYVIDSPERMEQTPQ